MSYLTIVIGSLLLVLGIAGFVLTGQTHITALIPAFFGLAYLLLGLIAFRKPSLRKHVMHVAALLSLLGIVGNISAIIAMPALLSGAEVARPAAVVTRFIMAILCAIHLIASIRSFLIVRLRPAQP